MNPKRLNIDFDDDGEIDDDLFTIVLIVSSLIIIIFFICLFLKRFIIGRNWCQIKLRLLLIGVKLIDYHLYNYRYKSIEYLKKLGDGHFGEVFLAKFIDNNSKETLFAIKRLRNGMDYMETKIFLSEGRKMRTFQHDRILSLKTMIFDYYNDDHQFRMPAIVMPFMVNGDLGDYLQQQQSINIVELLKFALQISDGMRYLSSINYIHGDLAARNCLLDEHFNIKISDFGLSQRLSKKSDFIIVHIVNIPIRWMAIECLLDHQQPYSNEIKCTKKSDIWSFGVLLWEIFTLGSYPYEFITDTDQLIDYLSNGNRLDQPIDCPADIYQLMQFCWQTDVDRRPNFEFLFQQIELIKNNSPQLSITLADTSITSCNHINYSNLTVYPPL